MRETLLLEPHSHVSFSPNSNSNVESGEANTSANLNNLEQNLNNPNIIRHFSNETILLVFLMITLFFVNVYSIIKNQILKTLNNVISRIWRKIIQNPPKNYFADKPKVQINNKFEINHCAICLNTIDYEVSVSCFHRFCGNQDFFKILKLNDSSLCCKLLDISKSLAIKMPNL